MKILQNLKGLLLFLLLTNFVSCTDKDDSNSLIGTWSWVSTDGGLAFHIHDTPVSTGKNIDLQITSNGQYFIYTNGIITSKGTYIFSTQKSIVDGTNKKSIIFSVGGEMMIDKIDNLNLELSQNAFDGIGSSYIRK